MSHRRSLGAAPSALPSPTGSVGGYLVGPGASLRNAGLRATPTSPNVDLSGADLTDASLRDVTLTRSGPGRGHPDRAGVRRHHWNARLAPGELVGGRWLPGRAGADLDSAVLINVDLFGL